MSDRQLRHGLDIDPAAGQRMHRFVEDAFGLYRSITGDGVRRTLDMVRQAIPLDVVEVPTGTPVLDWVVPQEWSVREAYVVAPNGERLFDVAEHNLHLVGYSVPFRGVLSLDELKPHLHSLPDRPDLIPHRTSYYVPAWGFCATQRQVDALEPGDYEVVVDSALFDGSLTYGELVLPGDDEREVLVVTHTCHPSLANDNLSGIAVATEAARALAGASHRFTYRFLFMPATIGAITWLATNREVVDRVHCGLVITGMGDTGGFVYKRSRRGDTVIDRVAEVVLGGADGSTAGGEGGAQFLDWYPSGYDERQFCSPGFDLAVGRLTRSLHATFPEYHTSGDDLSFVHTEQLVEGAETVLRMLAAVDGNAVYRNLAPFGEPRLGPRGLFGALGGGVERSAYEAAILWLLSLSDGEHDLLSIAERSHLDMAAVVEAADRLVDADLLAPVEGC